MTDPSATLTERDAIEAGATALHERGEFHIYRDGKTYTRAQCGQMARMLLALSHREGARGAESTKCEYETMPAIRLCTREALDTFLARYWPDLLRKLNAPSADCTPRAAEEPTEEQIAHAITWFRWAHKHTVNTNDDIKCWMLTFEALQEMRTYRSRLTEQAQEMECKDDAHRQQIEAMRSTRDEMQRNMMALQSANERLEREKEAALSRVQALEPLAEIGGAIKSCDRVRMVGSGGSNYFMFEFWIRHECKEHGTGFADFVKLANARSQEAALSGAGKGETGGGASGNPGSRVANDPKFDGEPVQVAAYLKDGERVALVTGTMASVFLVRHDPVGGETFFDFEGVAFITGANNTLRRTSSHQS